MTNDPKDLMRRFEAAETAKRQQQKREAQELGERFFRLGGCFIWIGLAILAATGGLLCMAF